MTEYIIIFSISSIYFFVKRRFLDIFLFAHATLLLYSSVILSGEICITTSICHDSVPSDLTLSYVIVDFTLLISALISDLRMRSGPYSLPINFGYSTVFKLYLKLLALCYFLLLAYLISSTSLSLLFFSHKIVEECVKEPDFS